MFKKLLRIVSRLRSKIIMKVLYMPVVKRRLEEIGRVYELPRIVYDEYGMAVDRDMLRLDGNQEVHLNFSHYLPDTEERIERLRRVINKRPVAIILLGPSLTELEQRITELENCDICYFGLNDYWVTEQNILQKISRNISLFMCCSFPYGNPWYRDNAIKFLERQGDNILVSDMVPPRPQERSQRLALDKLVEKYDKKLLFFTSIFTSIRIKYGLFLPVPSIEYPLHFPRQGSFSILLSMALIGEAPKVVVFGGDGGRINKQEFYFKGHSRASPDSVQEKGIMKDTRIFNVTMPLILEKIYKLYNLKPVDIINCSEQSHYTPFRKLSYDETFAELRSFKTDLISDDK